VSSVPPFIIAHFWEFGKQEEIFLPQNARGGIVGQWKKANIQ
jgi:hypothetical protein